MNQNCSLVHWQPELVLLSMDLGTVLWSIGDIGILDNNQLANGPENCSLVHVISGVRHMQPRCEEYGPGNGYNNWSL